MSFSAQGAVSQWVDIHVENGALWVDTEIAGVSGYSMIDSGAQINGINNGFLKASGQTYRTGQSLIISGVYGRDERRTYLSVPAALFGSEIDFKGLVDLEFGGPQAQLMLGAPFLKQFVFQFDYPNKRMRVITRDSINMKKIKNVKSKSDMKTGEPIVRVRLNDEKDVWLLLDTGNSGGALIERQVATMRGWLEKYPSKTRTGTGINSSGNYESFNLPTFAIGEFELENVIINVPPENKEFEVFEKKTSVGSRLAKSRKQSKGILGYDVLKHFVVTIDYKGGHVHLEAPEG